MVSHEIMLYLLWYKYMLNVQACWSNMPLKTDNRTADCTTATLQVAN